MSQWILYVVFGSVMLASALGVVFCSNPVHAALSLVASLLAVAGLFLAQEAFFLSVVQIIVYTGAIVVLFLFVIMLLGIDRTDPDEERLLRQQWFPLAFTGGVVAIFALVIVTIGFNMSFGAQAGDVPEAIAKAGGNVEAIAEELFTNWLLPFELTSVLLVAAIVGSVVLAKRGKHLRGSGIGVTEDVAAKIREVSEARDAADSTGNSDNEENDLVDAGASIEEGSV